jgi:outer membrane protein insertion porin family
VPAFACDSAGCGVEVPIQKNNMRVSPVLAAVAATAAALGSVAPAQGQTSSDTEQPRLQLPLPGSRPQQPSQQPLEVQPQPSTTPGTVEPQPTATPATPQLQPFTPPDTTQPQELQLAPPQPSQQPLELQPFPANPNQPEQPQPTAPSESPQPGQTPATEPSAPPSPDTGTPPSEPGSPGASTEEAEPKVLVAEVAVDGAEGTLLDEVYKAISTKPGRTATRSQLQADVNAIFATGFFSKVRVEPSDTPLGVRVTFIVQVNPVLQKVQTSGTQVLPAEIVEKTFSPQYGKTLNFKDLQTSIKELNKWYQDNGYVLAQVVGAPQVSDDGVVTLDIAEGVIEDIQIKYVSKTGEEVDAKGRPIRGRTKPYVILREVELKPGAVFNRNKIQADLQRVFGLGIFEDVKVALSPGQDPRKAVVTLNVAERASRSFSAGGGYSSSSGLFATGSAQLQNFRGRNQKIGAEVQVGQRDLLFDLSFTDPWIKGDPYRTSYTANIFRRQSISLVFNGDNSDIKLPNDDRPRVDRIGTGLTFTRPLSKNPFVKSVWTASLGFQYQHVSIRDADNNLSPRSRAEDGSKLLSFSSSGIDDITTVQFGLVRDLRNSPTLPTKGSLFRIGTEQSIPIGSGSILFNRVRANYSYYIPVKLLKTKKEGQTLAFNLQGGGIVGDLPPYEAFALGGSNSVRGYAEGELGTARYFLQGTVEYRFPIFKIISGALFFDAATDFSSGSSVPGNPAGVRNLPGSGFGGGAGVRINSPLGPIRVDYGVNDQGEGRLSFGIGQRF